MNFSQRLEVGETKVTHDVGLFAAMRRKPPVPYCVKADSACGALAGAPYWRNPEEGKEKARIMDPEISLAKWQVDHRLSRNPKLLF